MERLTEELILADINELHREMNTDPSLKKLLTTKAKDFPPDSEYLFLIRELTEHADETLLDIIEMSLKYSMRGTKTKSYFVKAKDRLIGFVAYIVMGNEIIEVKMFSFDVSRPNPVIIRDLENLVVKLLKEGFEKISWSAMPENGANAIYERAIAKFNGKSKMKDDIIRYVIEKKDVEWGLYN